MLVASKPDLPPLDAPAVVLDTNVVLAWLVFRDPAMGALMGALERGELVWLATEPILAEARHMLSHPSLARWGGDRDLAREVLDSRALRVPEPMPPKAGWPRCSDADDQKFVDLAIGHPARWLVSRDRAVLKLRRRMAAFGVVVVTPQAWEADPRLAGAGNAG